MTTKLIQYWFDVVTPLKAPISILTPAHDSRAPNSKQVMFLAQFSNQKTFNSSEIASNAVSKVQKFYNAADQQPMIAEAKSAALNLAQNYGPDKDKIQSIRNALNNIKNNNKNKGNHARGAAASEILKQLPHFILQERLKHDQRQ